MGTDLDAMREVAFKIKGDIDHSSADIAGLATNIFSVLLFVKKIIDLPGGQINDPHRGHSILFRSSKQLPRLRLRPSKGFLS